MNKYARDWDRSLNLGAYSEVEADSNYATPEALEKYRNLLLEKSEPAAVCISKIVPSPAKLSVLELCSGSGRLLFALNKLDRLAKGTGVEVSPSRFGFSEKWKTALHVQCVRNIQASVHEYSFDQGDIDVAVLIDGALSYIYPASPELPERALARVAESLLPTGKILLECDVLSPQRLDEMRRHGHVRTWNKGDDNDTFAYALYQTRLVNWDHMIVESTSLYLPRLHQSERVKRELYKYYDATELKRMFDRLGFKVEFYGSFSLEPWTEHSTSLIAIASRH